MSLSQKTLVFFVLAFTILTFLSGVMDRKEVFLATTLTADITPTDLTIPVASTEGWNSHGLLWIGREHIRYSSKTDTSFIVASRGFSYGTLATEAKAHSAGAIVKAPEADILNTLMGFDVKVISTNAGDLVGLGLLVWNFVRSIPRLIMWDYAFLQGDLALIRILVLYPISIGFIVTFSMVFVQWGRALFRLT